MEQEEFLVNRTKRLRLKHLAEEITAAEDALRALARKAGSVGAGPLQGRVSFFCADLRVARRKIEGRIGKAQ